MNAADHFEHMAALRLRLSNERGRLAAARSAAERELRAVWVAQCEREIASAIALFGDVEPSDTMSDDELLAALLS